MKKKIGEMKPGDRFLFPRRDENKPGEIWMLTDYRKEWINRLAVSVKRGVTAYVGEEEEVDLLA